jgi:hypothetical protein
VDPPAGLGVTDERQQLATPPKPSVLEYLVSPKAASPRRLSIGAEPQSDGGVHFRVWAPRCRELVVEIEGLDPAALQPENDGYFSLRSLPARAGMRYRYRLDGDDTALPDPASRFQPDGPHGPSEQLSQHRNGQTKPVLTGRPGVADDAMGTTISTDHQLGARANNLPFVLTHSGSSGSASWSRGSYRRRCHQLSQCRRHIMILLLPSWRLCTGGRRI